MDQSWLDYEDYLNMTAPKLSRILKATFVNLKPATLTRADVDRDSSTAIWQQPTTAPLRVQPTPGLTPF